MTIDEILDAIRALPVEEQDELFDRIEDEFFLTADNLTPEQVAELDRCAEEFVKQIGSGIPWEQVKAGLIEEIGREAELSPEEKAELGRRLNDQSQNPDDVISLEEIKAKREGQRRK